MTQPGRVRAVLSGLAVAALPAAALAGTSRRPMYYLRTFGSPGHEIQPLAIALLATSVVVVVVIAALVLIGVSRARRVRDMREDRGSVAEARDDLALPKMHFGLALTVAILGGFVVWTIVVLVDIRRPPGELPTPAIEVTGHMWWWEVAYYDGDRKLFETANEVHLPVGEPVRLRLKTADVIHTFWVPAIGGKRDMIPGQVNIFWLRADEPGVYRGTCNEYCGRQHTNMGLRLVAESPEEFRDWLEKQQQPAAGMQTAAAAPGSRPGTDRLAASAAPRPGALPARREPDASADAGTRDTR